MTEQRISKEEYLRNYEMDINNLQKSYETIFARRKDNLLNNQTELAELATQDLQEVSLQMTEMMEAKNKFLAEYQEHSNTQADSFEIKQEQGEDYDYRYGCNNVLL